MKKAIKILTVMVTSILILTISIVPAMAVSFDFESAFSEKENQENYEKFESEYEKYANELMQEALEEQEEMMDNASKTFKGFFTFVIVLIIIAVILGLAAMAYIYVEAPKCGMSRAWALVPLFSSFIGLLVFIVVRSNSKTHSSRRTITCPTCSGKYPEGTIECSICGTKLK